jgi:hypothetical protein
VEECLWIDVNQLWREGFMREGQVWSGSRVWRNRNREKVVDMGWVASDALVHLVYSVRSADGAQVEMDYNVPVVRTSCNFGGKRPWFVCPGWGCGLRVAKLYLPLPVRRKRFLSRRCHGLAYASQSEDCSQSAYRKARKIAERLGGGWGGGLEPPCPPRPRGMHHATYERLRAEYEDLTSLGLIMLAGRVDKSLAAEGRDWSRRHRRGR